MKIKLSYVDGKYCFELEELNQKVIDFFKSAKLKKHDARGYLWTTPVARTIKTDTYGEVSAARFVYTKLIKHIKVLPGVSINKLDLEMPGLSSDGVNVKYVYDADTARNVGLRNGWIDPKQFRAQLSRHGFKHDKVAWVAPASVELLAWLHSIELHKLSNVEESYRKLCHHLFAVRQCRESIAYAFQSVYADVKLYAGGKTPYKHQTDFLEGIKSWGNYLALDMGLGKTWTALYAASIVQRYIDVQIIVLCPRSVKQNWAVTAQEDFGLSISVYTTASIPSPSSITGNYIVIADEAHFASDVRSKRSQAYMTLCNFAVFVLNLSGTACTNGRPSDLYAQLKAIGFEGTTDIREYQNTYGWEAPLTSKSMFKLAEALGTRYYYRHTTQCIDLPKLTRAKHYISLTKEQEQVFYERFQTFMDIFNARVQAGEASNAFEYFVELQGLRLSIAKAKAKHCAELASDIVDHGHQVAVYSDFVESLEDVHYTLSGLNMRVCWLKANDSDEERYQKQKAFQAGQYDVFLCTYRCGGVGIELTPCDRMILIDRPWSPAMVTQCEKRIARIGQTKPVLIYWAYWQDPQEVEHKIEDIIMKKQENIDAFNDFEVQLSEFEPAKPEALDVAFSKIDDTGY